MASVRKRTLPSGKAVWQVDYKDQAGNRRSRQFRTKKEADGYETKARAEVAQGIHTPDSVSVTVAAAAELWIEAGQRDGLEASTITQRDQHMRLHIVPLIGDLKLSQLTTPKVKAFKDELLKTRSQQMARAVLTSLKGIMKVARRRGLIAQNLTESVTVDKRRIEDEDDAPIPPKDDIRAMLAQAPETYPLSRVTLGRWVAWRGTPATHRADPLAPFGGHRHLHRHAGVGTARPALVECRSEGRSDPGAGEG